MDADVLRAQEALKRLYAGERTVPVEVPKPKPRQWGGARTALQKYPCTAEDLAQEQVHSKLEGEPKPTKGQRGSPWPGAGVPTDVRFAPSARYAKVGDTLAAARQRLAEKEAALVAVERRLHAREEVLR